MLRRFAIFLIILIFAVSAAAAVRAATNLDAQNYHKAFALLDKGHPEHAVLYAVHGRDPVLNKVLRAAYMAQPGNDIGFGSMIEFVSNEPDWPGLKGILAIAEQKIPSNLSPDQTVNWFTAHAPVTPIGFYHYIDALSELGRTGNIPALIRARWIDGDFTGEEMAAFYSRYGRFLDIDANDARLDRLLWRDDVNGARAMYPYVDENHRRLGEARLVLAAQLRNADAYVAAVPYDLQDNPGLLYERLRWLQRTNRDAEATEILLHAPEQLVKPEAWWDQRQIMIRRAMERREYGLAQRLAAGSGLTEGKDLLQADFLAGWLALRFLNQPHEAEEYFRALYDSAQTPISRARGGYWLGRAYEAMGDDDQAAQAYEKAATVDITYYGQLAAAKLDEHPTVHALPEPAIANEVRNKFLDRDVIRAIERLHDIGENDRAHSFFRAAVANATRRSDFDLLMETAYRIKRPDFAVEAAKAANQKDMVVGAGGFPVLDRKLPRAPEPAFIHALIRQESGFNPNAESPAGARGLMQLMPHTAKAMARKCGVKFGERRMCEVDYNIRLGTTYIQDQLNEFNDSYVLTLAAYNAGPGRVRQWLNDLGDPRSANVDPVDWIEEIPITETRNYVQRIMESLQVYRARLNGGKAPLTIWNDLKR